MTPTEEAIIIGVAILATVLTRALPFIPKFCACK